MKRRIWTILTFVVVVSLITSLSLAGCKEEVSKEETMEEATEEVAEETVEESGEEVSGEDTETEAVPEGKVTLRYSHGWTWADNLWSNMVSEWAEQYPNLELVQEVIAGDEIRNKIRTDAAADNMPDIINFFGRSLARDYMEEGFFLPIDEYLKVSENVTEEDMPQLAWEIFSHDGVVYGVPLVKVVGWMSYNKEIFDTYNLEPPKTYDEMLEVSEVLNANDIIPLNMGSKGGNPSHLYFSEIYNQLPGGIEELANFKENWNFATDNAITTAEIILQQAEDHMYPKDTVASGDWEPTMALYNGGKAAMCYTYTFMVADMPDEIIGKSVLMDVPQLPGGVVDPSKLEISLFNVGFYLSNKSWADPDKQYYMTKLADWIISDETQRNLLLSNVIVPVKKGVVDSVQGMELDTHQEWMSKILTMADSKNAVSCHYIEWPPDTESFNLFQSELDVLFAGGTTAEEFVQKIQDALDEAKAASE